MTYVDPKVASSSYRPRSNLMSPGMKRARQPYFVKNAITGVILATFAFGMWTYSMNAVKQDVFDDVDEEAKALATARQKSLARQDERKANASRSHESQ